MFELETMTPAKLVDVRVLSQKNRQPDDNPGVKLVVEMSLADSVLAGFDGSLKHFLFTAAPASGGKKPKGEQASLDGVEPVSDTPNLTGIGQHVGVLRWQQDLTGYSLAIDLGLGGRKSNLLIDDCTLSTWRMTPKQGGSVTLKFNLESQDASDAAWAKLAKLKSREVNLTLLAPVVSQEVLDAARPSAADEAAFYDGPDNPFGSTDPAEAAAAGRKPKPKKAGAVVDATAAFVAAHRGVAPGQ